MTYIKAKEGNKINHNARNDNNLNNIDSKVYLRCRFCQVFRHTTVRYVDVVSFLISSEYMASSSYPPGKDH